MIIPIPKHREEEEIKIPTNDYARIRQYLDVPNWKCLKCGAVMFGRCPHCVYCKMKLGVITPRPP